MIEHVNIFGLILISDITIESKHSLQLLTLHKHGNNKKKKKIQQRSAKVKRQDEVSFKGREATA